MAYGKIKADTIVYDNSGTDTDVTVVSLTTKAPLPASAGTVAASEVVQVDANKDITGFRNVTLSGNLTVNGTTTTINSTTLAVDDKNIELGTVDTPSDTTADGGGITLKGATDKTITWTNSTDSWDFNQNIKTSNGTANLTIQNTSNTSYGGLEFDKADGNAQFAIYSYDASHGSHANKVQLYNYTNSSIEFYTNSTLALTLTNSQNATFAGAVSDSKGDVRKIPQTDQTGSSAYTIHVNDRGKCISRSGGNVTFPTNNGSVLTAGDAVTILNNSGSDITIDATSASWTLYNTADASTGNRTLAARGLATIYVQANSVAYISGSGLS